MSTIRIKQTRSAINRPANQKATIKALGFRKLNQEIEKEVTPQIIGMINKVKHLIEIIEK
jgi:large subunit ribosomal protein L30